MCVCVCVCVCVYAPWGEGSSDQQYEQRTPGEAAAVVQERGNDDGQGMCYITHAFSFDKQCFSCIYYVLMHIILSKAK